MARGFIAFAFAILVGALISTGNAQQEPGTDSVADAAREQKQLKSEKKKPAQKKVYSNSDVVKPDAAAPSDTQTNPQTTSWGARAEAGASSPVTDPPTVVKNQKNQNSGDGRSTIFDRPKPDSPETIVVPSGTKITVDISEENPPRNVQLRLHSGKVVNIVQVGSTVVIPALSKVTIQDSAGVMELTEVTLGGVHYKLQTDRVPLQEGSISEATFTVARDFTIQR
jgi:hypothetical protein